MCLPQRRTRSRHWFVLVRPPDLRRSGKAENAKQHRERGGVRVARRPLCPEVGDFILRANGTFGEAGQLRGPLVKQVSEADVW